MPANHPYVIVGAMLTGAKAAEALREEGFDGAVVLIGTEDQLPYERPPLSKGYLLGKEPRDSAFVHPADWYAEHGPQMLADALRGYLQYLVVERGLAANTVESYRRDLLRYVSVLAGHGTTRLGDVTTADVAEFLASLREGDEEHAALAVSSAARAVIAVRGLHAFAVAQGLAEQDPARDVPPPTPPRRLLAR